MRISEKMVEAVAQRFRLLGEPTRLRILQCLEDGEMSVNEMVSALSASQPNISKHLQVLHAAGILERRRAANNIYYAIADPVIPRLCKLVCDSAMDSAREHFEGLKKAVPARRRSW
ncbi:MAG: metalloregulator ArsR/SmtB family transcription factor [Terriglobales bacterium]